MCYICHSENKDQIQQQFKNELKKSQKTCHMWNTTSINHLLLSTSNNDGCQSQRLSIQLLENFYIWYKNNRLDKYLPDNGMEKMYSKQCISNLLEITRYNQDLSQEQLLKSYSLEIDEDKNTKPENSCFDKYYYYIKNSTCGIIASRFYYIKQF